MASEKKCVHLTLDAEVVDEAKVKYPNFSGRVNELVKADLQFSDDEDVLLKEMEEAKAHYHAAKSKLCKYKQKKQAMAKDENRIKEVLSWARVVYERRGVLGLKVLERECKKKKVSFENIKEILDKEDVAFVNFDS